jgi:hypothetical protein
MNPFQQGVPHCKTLDASAALRQAPPRRLSPMSVAAFIDLLSLKDDLPNGARSSRSVTVAGQSTWLSAEPAVKSPSSSASILSVVSGDVVVHVNDVQAMADSWSHACQSSRSRSGS